MVELRDHPGVATLFAQRASYAPGDVALRELALGEVVLGEIVLGADAAQHARARRIAVGDRVRLTDGVGHLASAQVTSIGKETVTATVEEITDVAPLAPLHLFVPVADRDRTLMLAEKIVELGATSWHPVVFHRSRSVASRGEGESFERRLRARMVAALEQSGGAWLPTVHEPSPLDQVIDFAAATKLLMDAGGAPIMMSTIVAPVAALVGPEGGLESREVAALTGAGWRPARLAGNTLRFETAGIAAAAVLRAVLANP